jgi:integrase
MIRSNGRLTSLAVSKVRKPGLYPDGDGLYLQVSGARGRSWIFRYTLRGKARAMGLGPAEEVPLAVARATVRDYRQELRAGRDPIESRKARKAQVELEAAQSMTFKACAEAYIAGNKSQWRNAKHIAEWGTTLIAYAYPVIGALPVQKIDVRLVVKVLQPIWATKSVTAGRVRGRIEIVLDWATALGYRQGENPARWRGHLDKILPRHSRIRKVKHHAAVPYQQVGAFMAKLRAQTNVAARALEFAILTAARSGEVSGARHSEFDDAIVTWTVPGTRMKGGQEHRVPLSAPATAIVKAQIEKGHKDLVFPNLNGRGPLYSGAMIELLERMDRKGVTVHGFRSTFRDWVAEQTAYPRELAEKALAHTIEDKTEGAYQRGDLLEKRRRLMDEWARYCAKPAKAGVVVRLRRTSD